MIHLYKCKRHGELRLALSPRENRLATGRAVRCPRCGSFPLYLGKYLGTIVLPGGLPAPEREVRP